jgi:hypothetical protein
VKKSLTALLLVPAAVAALAVPAGASVPNREPAFYACPGTSGAAGARVWMRTKDGRLTQLAVENHCPEYMALGALEVAPGAHFNWGQSELRRYGITAAPIGLAWPTDPRCGDRVVRHYNDVRPAC